MNSQLYIWGKLVNCHQQCQQSQYLAKQHLQASQNVMNTVENYHKDVQKENVKNFRTILIQQQIQQVSCGEQHFVLRCKNNIFVAGDNSKGQLGLIKHSHDTIDLTKLELNASSLSKNSSLGFQHNRTANFKSLGSLRNIQRNSNIKVQQNLLYKNKNISIKAVSCGAYHTLLLTQNGEVLSSGLGKNGALGYGDGENSYSFKQVIKGGVIKVSAGADHSLALTKTKVYGWGSSKEGQLGISSKRIFYNPKQLNVYPSNDIFAGNRTSFFNTVKGIFGVGLNNEGQLGLGHQNAVFSPKRLNIDEQIVKIQGNRYFIAVTKNNEGLLWGNGSFGKFLFPTRLQFITDIAKYTVSQNFGLVKSASGSVLVWGNNTDNQICLEKSIQQYAIQSKILSQLNIQNLASGKDFVIGWQKIQNEARSSGSGRQKQQKECNKVQSTIKTAKAAQRESTKQKIVTKQIQKGTSQGRIRIHSRNNSQDLKDRVYQHKHLYNTEAIGFKAVAQETTLNWNVELPTQSASNFICSKKRSDPLIRYQQAYQQGTYVAQTKNYNNQNPYCQSQLQKIRTEKSEFKPESQSLQNLNINQSRHSLRISDTRKKIVQTARKQNCNQQIQKLKAQTVRLRKQNQGLRREKVMKETYEAQCSGIKEIAYENEMLRRQSQKKSAYITKIRQEYLLLLDIVQNSKFLQSVLHLKNQNHNHNSKFTNSGIQLYHEGATFQSKTKDEFTRQITYLKEILQSAYKN